MKENGKDLGYIRFYDTDMNLVKEVSEWNSLIFTERAETIGEFEIHLRERDMDISTFGYYIRVNDDPTMSGIIEYEYWNGDGLNQNEPFDYVLKGYTLMGILANRIIVPRGVDVDGYVHYNNKPIEDVMQDLCYRQMVNAEDKKRNIPEIQVWASQHRGKQVTVSYRNEVLSDVLTDLISQTNLYFEVELRLDIKKICIWVKEGKDRRTGTDKYTIAKKFDRVVSETMEHSTLGTANYAYVYGEGDSEDRTMVKVFKRVDEGVDVYEAEYTNTNPIYVPQGLMRRETYVDAKNISDEVQTNRNSNGLSSNQTDPNYNVQYALRDRGEEKLREMQESACLEFEATPDEYGIRYNLGDRLFYRNEETGTYQEGKVTEVVHTWEDHVHNIQITTGHTKTTIMTAIKTAGVDATVERVGMSMKFKSLEAEFAHFNELVAGKATIRDLDAYKAEIETLMAKYATIEQLNADMVNVNNLMARYATIDYVNSRKITADDIVAGSITVDMLKYKSITNYYLADDSVQSGTIKDGAVGTSHLSNSAVTNSKIASSTITGSKLAGSTITGAKIAGSTITGSNIAGSTIEGANIKSGTITTNNLATDAIKSRNYAYSGSYSNTTAGSFLDLSNGAFYTKNFKVDTSGNVKIAGDLTLNNGEAIYWKYNSMSDYNHIKNYQGNIEIDASGNIELTNVGHQGKSIDMSSSEIRIDGLSTIFPDTSNSVQFKSLNLDIYSNTTIHANYRNINRTENILLLAYPVGSIYMSTNSTNPANLFGGSWSAISSGRVLVASGSGFTAMGTGGESTHSHGESDVFSANTTWSSGSSYTSSGTVAQNYYHSTASSNSYPLYYSVYMWRRTG